ncbi:MAG: VWA domain-containing protein [Candidatus Hydrothermarchaeota archaeon]
METFVVGDRGIRRDQTVVMNKEDMERLNIGEMSPIILKTPQYSSAAIAVSKDPDPYTEIYAEVGEVLLGTDLQDSLGIMEADEVVVEVPETVVELKDLLIRPGGSGIDVDKINAFTRRGLLKKILSSRPLIKDQILIVQEDINIQVEKSAPSLDNNVVGMVTDDTGIEVNISLVSGYVGSDVVLVIDKSNSMEGKRIEEAKKAAIEFFKTKVSAARLVQHIGVVAYSTDVEEIVPMTPAHVDKMEFFEEKIKGIKPEGITALLDATAYAIDMLKKSQGENIKEIILLTDGYENASKNYDVTDVDKVASMAKDQGIILFGVGVGDADIDFLKYLAEPTGGSVYKATPDELRKLWKEFAQTLKIRAA